MDEREAQLRAAIAEWRATADVWERHTRYEHVPNADKKAHDRPPQPGMGAIRNWINWLRNKAAQVEAILDSTQVGSVPVSTSAEENKPRDAN
jgi:hypothetical protein